MSAEAGRPFGCVSNGALTRAHSLEVHRALLRTDWNGALNPYRVVLSHITDCGLYGFAGAQVSIDGGEHIRGKQCAQWHDGTLECGGSEKWGLTADNPNWPGKLLEACTQMRAYYWCPKGHKKPACPVAPWTPRGRGRRSTGVKERHCPPEQGLEPWTLRLKV